jgi:hypothetical protein
MGHIYTFQGSIKNKINLFDVVNARTAPIFQLEISANVDNITAEFICTILITYQRAARNSIDHDSAGGREAVNEGRS